MVFDSNHLSSNYRDDLMAKMKNVVLMPSISLQAKMGSIAVHAEEFISPGGHPFDRDALKSLLQDPEVREWLDNLRGMALLPVKR